MQQHAPQAVKTQQAESSAVPAREISAPEKPQFDVGRDLGNRAFGQWLQSREVAGAGSSDEREANHRSDQAVRGPGPSASGWGSHGSGPLAPSLRGWLEPQLGHDLGGVRIHTGPEASQAAASMGALAFTYGRDIVFGAGQFDPTSAGGQRLLAHELTHTAQPGNFIRRQSAAAESRRIVTLGADYSAALFRRDWAHAAELLNAYNDNDITARISEVNHEARVELYAGALRSLPGFHQRVTGAIAAMDPEARRVGQLIFDYLGAIEQNDWGRAATLLNAFSDAGVRERLNTLSPSELESMRTGALHAHVDRIAAAAAAVQSRRAFDNAVGRIRQISRSSSAADEVRMVIAAFEGIDLRSRENLTAAVRTITNHFGSDSGPVLEGFLNHVEASLPHREPTQEEVERMDRTTGLMQIGPRGPYRQYAPGVMFPVLSQAARGLLPAVEAMQNLYGGAGGFLSGLVEGLSGAVDEDHRRMFVNRLNQSQVLTSIFPPIFQAGTVVGVVEDVVDAVKGIYQLVANFRQFAEAIGGFVQLILSDQSSGIGRAIGREMGQTYGQRISTMAEGNLFRFTYELGRMIGPTILYIVLSFLGVPELAASAMVERLLPILRPLLQRYPRLVAVIEALAGRLRQRRAATILGRLEIAALRRTIAQQLRAEALHSIRMAEHSGISALARSLEANVARGANARVRQLLETVWNALQNPDAYAQVMEELITESQRVTTMRPGVTSAYTQAAINLGERGGSIVEVIPATVELSDREFFDQWVRTGRRSLDLAAPAIDASHGSVTHLIQDLVVDRALQQSGAGIGAQEFRRLIGRVEPNIDAMNLWIQLFDAGNGQINQPEVLMPILRRTLPGIQ